MKQNKSFHALRASSRFRQSLRLMVSSLASLVILLMPLTVQTSVNADTPSFTEYTVPTSGPRDNPDPYSITNGPDGALWFGYGGSAAGIGRISTTGQITKYTLPSGVGGAGRITTGPDGALWFTEGAGDSYSGIGRIDTNGTIVSYPLPEPAAHPEGITTGPDGALWFVEVDQFHGNKVGRITTSGDITEYPIPTANAQPIGIAAGSDGALWFTEENSDKIGRITTSGTITEYSLPDGIPGPEDIVSGPSGDLWFSEGNPINKIGRITTSGSFTEYSVPYNDYGPQSGIVVGADGNIWFTEDSADIGYITPSGVATELPLPTTDSDPAGIALGSDGAIWFTEPNANQIGRYGAPIQNPVPANLTLDPENGSNQVGETANFTATVTDADGNPVANIPVEYSVSGSVTTDGSCTTDENGQCTISYDGPQLPGSDEIDAYADSNSNGSQDSGEPTASATQTWTVPASTQGTVSANGLIPGSSTGSAILTSTFSYNGTSLSGSCLILDILAGKTVSCTSVSALVIDGSQATIFGNATVNGVATTYRIDITSSGLLGGTFNIVTASGYSAGGTLSGSALIL